MEFNNKPNKSIIHEDSTYWISRSPAITSYIVAKIDDKFYLLIGKRGQGSADYKGLWNIPSGYLDWNEDGTGAFFRETWEETGVNCNDLLNNYNVIYKSVDAPWFVDTNPNSHLQNITLHYTIIFDATDKSLPKLTTENSEPDEVENLMWVNVEDLSKIHFAFDHKDRCEHFKNEIINKL